MAVVGTVDAGATDTNTVKVRDDALEAAAEVGTAATASDEVDEEAGAAARAPTE